MNTPRNKFTVMPVVLALLVSALQLPALNIIQVDRAGMGIEHMLPRKGAVKSMAVSLLDSARTLISRVRAAAIGASGHALFRPALAAAACLVAAHFHPHALMAAPVLFGTLTEGGHTAEFLADELDPLMTRESITVLSGQNLAAGAVVGRVKFGIGRVSIPAVVGTGNGTIGTVFAGPEVQAGNYVIACITAATDAGTFSVTNPSGKRLPNATVGVAYTSREINFTIADGSSDFIVGDTFTCVVNTTAPTVIGGTGTGVMTALSLGPDAKPGRYQVINRAVVANGGDFEVIGPDGASVGRFLMGTGSAGTAAFTSRTVNFTLSDATDYILGNYFDICVFNNLAGGKVVAWDPTTFDGRHKAEGVLYAATDATSADKGGVIVNRLALVMKSALSWGTAITAAQKESAYKDLASRHVIAIDSVTT